MTEQLTRARLTPFDEKGATPQTDKMTRFDFNPETLTLKVSSGQQQDKARKGRGQVQSVGASAATLSFEAIFDTSRPRTADDVRAEDRNDDDALDVRKRTKPIADLLANAVPGGDKAAKEKSPRRVRFQWGMIVFDGIITSYQESFDFFSPNGTPLRSKVQITISEQDFAYSVDAGELARQAAAPPSASARTAAAAAGQDSLFGGPGAPGSGIGGDFDLSLSAAASVSLSASFAGSLGLDGDLGLSLQAGIRLDAEAALSVFGPGAVIASSGIGQGDAGLSGLKMPGSSGPVQSNAGITPPPSAWAPDGPAAGSTAAKLAGRVLAARNAFGSPNADMRPAAIQGSPPPIIARAQIEQPAMFGRRSVPITNATAQERRPRWEGALSSGAAVAMAQPRHDRSAGDCGCRHCCGGGR